MIHEICLLGSLSIYTSGICAPMVSRNPNSHSISSTKDRVLTGRSVRWAWKVSPWRWKDRWTCVPKGTTTGIVYSVYCGGRVYFIGKGQVLLESGFAIYSFLRGLSPRSIIFNMYFKSLPMKVASSGVMGTPLFGPVI